MCVDIAVLTTKGVNGIHYVWPGTVPEMRDVTLCKKKKLCLNFILFSKVLPNTHVDFLKVYFKDCYNVLIVAG